MLGAIVPFVQLRPYQREAVDFLAAHGRAILAYPPGTGKTATVSSWLGGSLGVGTILVVCPNGPVLQHWAAELGRWGAVPAAIGTGTPKLRKLAREWTVHEGGALVVNYETMRCDIDALTAIPWDAVVFDEAHRLKNRQAQTFAAARKLARRAPRLALVTGTPIMNSAEEIWTSLAMLDPKAYGSFWRWAEVLFDIGPLLDARKRPVRSGGKLVMQVGAMKPGAAATIRAQLAGRIIRKPLSELLPDLPPVTETYLTVELSAPERRLYDSMLEKGWMELDGAITTAEYAITRSLRLRQLASDWTAFGGAGLGAKGKAAVQRLDDLAPDQVLVLCAFQQTADAIAAAVDGAEAYHGGLSAVERADAIDAYRKGDVRVLVGTIATLGEGVDGLQCAHHMILVDRDWTPARNEQAIGREARSGQLWPVNVLHLVAADSIDQVVAAALRRKESVVNAILNSQGKTPCNTSAPKTATTSTRRVTARQ